MSYEVEGQMSIFDLDIAYTKMFPEPSLQMTEQTSAASLKKCAVSKTKTPLFLNLRNGNHADALWVKDIALLIESMTHNGLAFRKEDGAYVYSLTSTEIPHQEWYLNCSEKPIVPIPTKLSQILEKNPNPKYKLSAKACQGILNRADRRGKELPKMLLEALQKQASALTDGMSNPNTSNPKTESQNPSIAESADTAVESPM